MPVEMKPLPVAIRALLAQGAALALSVLAASLLHEIAGWMPGLPGLAFLQGGVAAALGQALKLPLWWLPIQLLFFPAAVAAASLDLPATAYFAAFAVLLLFYWSTCRTRVPLYLSGKQTWRRLAGLFPAAEGLRFIDLGSGLGGLPLYLAAQRPAGDYVGVEIAPAPWLISRLRAWWSGSRARFLRMDYARLDLADYDVVFAFLSPAAMPELWRKAAAEMKEGALLVSLAFPVPGVPPDLVLGAGGSARRVLYGWRMRRSRRAACG